MSLALARSSRSSSLQRTLRSSSDRALQDAIKNVARSKEEFVNLDKNIRQIMNLPRNRTRSWLAKGINWIVPKRFYPKLPTSVVKMIAEEFDALEAGEGKYRDTVVGIQLGLKNLTHAVREKGEQLESLRTDVERAKAENWNARRLHEYILEQAEMEVDEEIAELLDDKFSVLGEEEKESRRQRLLKQLEGNVAIGRLTVVLGVKSCYAGLEVFEVASGEYYNYITNYKPAAAIRDTAIALIEGSDTMHAGRDVIMETYDVSLRGIDNALEAARKCRDHSIVSVDMQKLLETGNKKIDDKLRILANEDQKRLREVVPSPIPRLEATNVIDIAPVPASTN